MKKEGEIDEPTRMDLETYARMGVEAMISEKGKPLVANPFDMLALREMFGGPL